MITGLLSAELSATCNALGYSSGSSYYIDPYAKETITDLIRYLRRDDEDHTIRRHLGCAKVLQTDLLPILIFHSDKEDLFDILLRLLVNLTNPALLIYHEELPSDRTARHYFLQLVSQLQSYKEAFTQQKVWEILAKKLGELLQIEYQERDEDQSRTMERILILARNVLQVPSDPDVEKRPDNDASVHDQVLWSLHQAGMVDMFLYIASTDHEQQYYMHILEIVSLMLREQNPATLASSALQRSVQEKERDEKELLEIRQREIMDKQSKMKKYAGSRHSRFGGTYIIKNVKSVSENDLIFHKPLSKAITLNFDFEKQRAKVPRNKVSLSYHSSERRSAFSVRLFLKEFCVEFLNGAYNPLMYKVRENLVRAVVQENDETYYFWAMKFFMEFNRLYKFQVKLISETMHQQIFHLVQTKMENWLELMITEKKKIPVISRRVHQALKAYQELLMTLQAMDKSTEESVRQSAKVIKSNVFYQSEYRELVVYLFNVFTETKFSRGYLKDLVETSHVFLKMLEHFCVRHQNMVVQGKARKAQKKKKKPAPKKSTISAANLESLWDEVAPELSAVLQGQVDIPEDIVPFDAASDLSMDQQKIEAMKKIQLELKQGNFERAVGLIRTSREVWPENDSFGHANMAPEEEFLSMREIFMTDIGQPAEVPREEEGEDSDDEEEEDARNIVVPEQTFKFIEFAARFASPRVLGPICLLLEQFQTNSTYTNHCIVKLLHRVAWDCKMPAMLFQASLFRTFQNIFKSTNPEHKELVKFAIFIMRKFVEMSKKNKKIYMELLFWKNKKEADELEMGYNNTDSKSHSAKNVWREEQEDELRRLAAEYERDTPEPDAVGWIMKNMIDQTRSRRAVIKKMKELYLVVGSIKLKSNAPKEFGEEEVAELKTLYEQYKDSNDTMNCILGRLSVKRSRKAVLDKLLELGLISDKKQLRKSSSKSKKPGSTSNEWGTKSDDESIYDSWSEEEGDNAASSSGQQKKTKKTQRTGQPTQAQMCCNLQKVVDAELREPLEWLQSSLQEVVDDLADSDDDEGIALLPLNASSVQAMDNPLFLQLLDILSIEKPTDQEVYWRIPGRWKAEDLTKRIKLIKDALDGKLPDINPDEIEEMTQFAGIPRATSQLPAVGKKKKQKTKHKKSLQKLSRENNKAGSESSSEDSSSDEEVNAKSRQRNRASSNTNSSQSENSSDESSARLNSLQKVEHSLDSDKENGSINSTQSPSIRSVRKHRKSVKRPLGSGSEDELNTNPQKHVKTFTAKRIVDSSDSDVEENNVNLDTNSKKLLKRLTVDTDSEDEAKKIKSINKISSENGGIVVTEPTFNNEDDSLSQKSDFSSQKNGKNIVKRKRFRIESDSDDNDTINSPNTSQSKKITVKSRNSSRHSSNDRSRSKSDSDDDTINSQSKKSIVMSRNSSRHSSNDGSSSKSDSDDNDTTINSPRTSQSKKSTVRSRNSSRHSSNDRSSTKSDFDDNDTTINSPRTSQSKKRTVRSRNSSRHSSNDRSSTKSDSDDNDTTINSPRTSQSKKSTVRSRNSSRHSSNDRSSTKSDSDDNDTTINSPRTSQSKKSTVRSRNSSRHSSSDRSRSKSHSDDNDTTINSPRTSQSKKSSARSKKGSRRSSNDRSTTKSDSDDKDTPINSPRTSQSQVSAGKTRVSSRHSLKEKLSFESDSDDRGKSASSRHAKSNVSCSQGSSASSSENCGSVVKKRRLNNNSDSDSENSTGSKESVINALSQRSGNSSQKDIGFVDKKRKKSCSSDSDAMSVSNSGKPTATTPDQKRKFEQSKESNYEESPSITSSSKISLLARQSDDLRTNTKILKKRKRFSIDSESDDDMAVEPTTISKVNEEDSSQQIINTDSKSD